MSGAPAKGARAEGYFAGLSRNTFLLALASFFADISTEMLYPVLPVFLTQTLRASGSVVGLIEGVAQAVQNLVQGFSGSLSDRLKRHKAIALVGFAIAACSKPLIGLAAAWPGVLFARTLDRFGTGMRSAPRDALVAASADAAHRGRAFGLEGAGDNAGAFVGPLLAVVLLAVLAVPLRWIFLVAVVPGILALLMVLLVGERRDGEPPDAKVEAPPRRLPGPYLAYLGAIGLFGLGNSSNAFLILETKSLGASLTLTILIYAGFNLVASLASYPAGALSDRLGRRNLLALGLGVFVVVYAGFALGPGVSVVGPLFVLYGVFQGVFRAVGKALATDLAPQALRASAIGWFGTVQGLTGLVASAVAGVLWDRLGHAAVFALGAAFAAAGAAALLAFVRPAAGSSPAGIRSP